MKILGIEFAPLLIPTQRRVQTISILKYITTFLTGGFVGTIFLVSVLFTRFYFLSVLYLIWFVMDRRTPRQGGRRSHWVRHWSLWKHCCAYFPMKLIKTAELPTDKNYLFAYHPHGIFGIGGFMHFATEGSGFSDIFPGILPRLLILNGHFDFPLYREYLMSGGICCVTKDSVRHILAKEGTGNGACILIGGALEALESHPLDYTVMLNNRKGFVKLALENGASLVPIYSFGETELYDQARNPDGSILKHLQLLFTRYMGISLPVINGRGIFNYTFGLLPRRRPVHTVVGAPLSLEKIDQPNQEDVNKYHQLYKERLIELFEEHKMKYGLKESDHLRFV